LQLLNCSHILVKTYPPSLSLETGDAQIGGFFIFSMKYNKPALSHEDQLTLLVSRNLTCSDHTRALEWLTFASDPVLW
jgi:hypothetical protein